MVNQDGMITVVLKVHLHCEGCAEKVMKSVKRFEGVERVKADVGGGKVTVLGKVDPSKLRDRLAAKTQKQVDLVSPANTPKKGADEEDDSKKPAAEKGCNKSNGTKCKHGCSTVELKTRLHCDDCVKRIKKLIYDLNGVRSVTVDPQKNLVTVRGKMDAEALREELGKQLDQVVTLVEPKKDDGGEKKEKAGDKKEKASEKETGAGGGGKDDGGEKKEKAGEKETGAGGGGKDDGAKVEANRATYHVGYTAGAIAAGGGKDGVAKVEANWASYYLGYPAGAGGGGKDDGAKAELNWAGYTYRTDMMHAPQLFSDENPNACSVM